MVRALVRAMVRAISLDGKRLATNTSFSIIFMLGVALFHTLL